MTFSKNLSVHIKSLFFLVILSVVLTGCTQPVSTSSELEGQHLDIETILTEGNLSESDLYTTYENTIFLTDDLLNAQDKMQLIKEQLPVDFMKMTLFSLEDEKYTITPALLHPKQKMEFTVQNELKFDTVIVGNLAILKNYLDSSSIELDMIEQLQVPLLKDFVAYNNSPIDKIATVSVFFIAYEFMINEENFIIYQPQNLQSRLSDLQ